MVKSKSMTKRTPKKTASRTSAKKQPKNSLSTYRKKRHFNKTSEPYKTPRSSSVQKAKHPIFVVQKHDASHLHYDFRLEYRGVLKSWAVPKGIPTKLGVKHLAAPTEDHPLEWANFSGTIPEGEYGAGTVEIWDHGVYQNIKEMNGKPVSMGKCLEMGRIEVWLEGKRLKGGYALIRAQRPDVAHGEKEYWLILKMRTPKARSKLKG